MKIYILTEGGKKYGFGHIVRMLSVLQAFKAKGYVPVFVVNGDKTIKSIVEGYDCYFKDWVNDGEFYRGVCQDADVILIDSYLAPLHHYEMSSKSALSVFFDDNVRLDYPKSVVVNSALDAEKLPYKQKDGVEYLFGLNYAFLRGAFLNTEPKSLPKDIEQVFVSFGGTDKSELILSSIQAVEKCLPQACIKIVVPAKNSLLENFNSELAIEVIIAPKAKELADLMANSDVAISAGGLSLNELAVTNTPTVVVGIAENQLNNIRGMEMVGVIQYAGRDSEENLAECILEKLEFYKNPENRLSAINAAKKNIDGHGNDRLIKEICRRYYRQSISLRPADIGDAKALLDLANDDIVRQNSFTPEPIKWDSHVSWLDGKIADKNCILYCVCDVDEFLGQVRFDIEPEDNTAVISIGLTKKIRGLGLAVFIVENSIKKMIGEAEVKKILAYIKNSNTASILVFEKINFNIDRSTIINGYNSSIYFKEL